MSFSPAIKSRFLSPLIVNSPWRMAKTIRWSSARKRLKPRQVRSFSSWTVQLILLRSYRAGVLSSNFPTKSKITPQQAAESIEPSYTAGVRVPGGILKVFLFCFFFLSSPGIVFPSFYHLQR